MGVLVIRPVPKDVARELVIKGHYSHKWLASFGIHNFGIFREGAEADEECLGVASFGYMKSPRARVCESSVPGGWMIELNRMWLDDALGKNAETILLGRKRSLSANTRGRAICRNRNSKPPRRKIPRRINQVSQRRPVPQKCLL